MDITVFEQDKIINLTAGPLIYNDSGIRNDIVATGNYLDGQINSVRTSLNNTGQLWIQGAAFLQSDINTRLPIAQTGNFYPANGNPSGFINSSALSPYALTSNLTLTSGNLQTDINTKFPSDQTGAFYPINNPSGYLQKNNNLSEIGSPLTAFNNLKQPSTTGYAGVISLATTGEASLGTDNTKAITPLVLKNVISPLSSSRAPVGYLFIDGISTGRQVTAPLGAQASVVTGPHTVLQRFVTPSTAPTGDIEIGGGYADVPASNSPVSIALWMDSSRRIQVRRGSTTLYRAKRSTAALELNTPYVVVWTWSPDGTVALWINGEAQSLADTTGGGGGDAWTVPGTGTYLNIGRAGPMLTTMPVVINRAWTQADVDYYVIHNRVPPQDEFPGSALPTYTADFTAGTSGFVANTTGLTVNGNVDGVGGVDDCLRMLADAGASRTPQIRRDFIYPVSGARYRVTFDAYKEAGAGALYVGLGALGSRENTNESIALSDGVWTACAFEAIPVSYALRIACFSSASGSNNNTVMAGGTSVYFKNIKVVPFGTIASFDIGWTAQIKGKFNRINAAAWAGSTAMPASDKDVEIIDWEMSATGYLLGTATSHVFRDHKIEKIEAYPTTATPPTITLRRNSTSGGTPIINSVSSGTQNTWTSLTMNGATLDGNAGDYYHVTLGSSNNVKLRITLAKR